jgi:hypothetical protein
MKTLQRKVYLTVLPLTAIFLLSGCSHQEAVQSVKDFISPELQLVESDVLLDDQTEIKSYQDTQDKPVKQLSLPYVQDTHYWNILAKDVSQQIAIKMANQDVYIEHLTKENTTPFSVAFRNMLIAHLHANNVRVSKTRRIEKNVPLDLRLREMLEDKSIEDTYIKIRDQDQPNVLEFNAQVIHHKNYTIPDNVSFTSLDNIFDASQSNAPGIGVNKSSSTLASGPVTEIIVTTTIYNNGALINATANVYYIPEVSLEHYKKSRGKYMYVVTK